MPILDLLSQVATAFGAAPDAAHKRIWEEVTPWVKTLLVQAGPKWLPRLSVGISCEVAPRHQTCTRSAVAACDVCQKPCCLEHSRIDKYGDAICYSCIAAAIHRSKMERIANGSPAHAWNRAADHQQQQQRQQQPPPPTNGPTKAEVSAAWKTLKVKVGSSWVEIDASYKELLRKNHPDRFTTPEAKAKAEKRFKAVRSAYDLLKKVHQ